MARSFGTLAEYDKPGQRARFDRAMDYVRRRYPDVSAGLQAALAGAVIIRGAVPSDVRADIAEGNVRDARQRLEAIADPTRPKNLGWPSYDDTPGTGTWPERRRWWEETDSNDDAETTEEETAPVDSEPRILPEGGDSDQSWMGPAMYNSMTLMSLAKYGPMIANTIEKAVENQNTPKPNLAPEEEVAAIKDPQVRAAAKKTLEENRAVQRGETVAPASETPLTSSPLPNVAIPENAANWFNEPETTVEEPTLQPVDRFGFASPDVASAMAGEIDTTRNDARFGFAPGFGQSGAGAADRSNFLGDDVNQARLGMASFDAPTQFAQSAPADDEFSFGDVLNSAGSVLNSLLGISPAGAAPVNQRQRALGATRSRPVSRRLNNVLEYAARKAGVEVDVFSGGQPARGSRGSQGQRVGSTRHDRGNAADVRLYTVNKNGKRQRVNFLSKKGRDVYRNFIEAAAAAGATGIGAGARGYMGPEAIHVGFGSVASWGSAFEGRRGRALGFKAAKARGRRNRVKNLNRALASLRKGDEKAATRVASAARSNSTRSSLGAPKSAQGKRIDRRALARELSRDPSLKEHVIALAQAETGAYGEKAIQAVLETMFNRAQHRNNSLHEETRGRTGRRYYQPLQTNAFRKAQRFLARNPKKRDQIARQLDKVIAGSNVSKYALHNASAGVGRRAKARNPNSYVEIGNGVGKEVFYTKRGSRANGVRDPDERSFRRSQVAYLDDVPRIQLAAAPPRFSGVMATPPSSTANSPAYASLGGSLPGLPFAAAPRAAPTPEARPALTGGPAQLASLDPTAGVVSTEGFSRSEGPSGIPDVDGAPATNALASPSQNDVAATSDVSPPSVPSRGLDAEAESGVLGIGGPETDAGFAPSAAPVSGADAEVEAGVRGIGAPDAERGVAATPAAVSVISRNELSPNVQAALSRARAADEARNLVAAEATMLPGITVNVSPEQQAVDARAAQSVASQLSNTASAGPAVSARSAQNIEAQPESRVGQFAVPALNANAFTEVDVITQAELDDLKSQAVAEPTQVTVERSPFSTPDLAGGLMTGLQDDRLGVGNVTPATTEQVNQFGQAFGFGANDVTPVAQSAFGISVSGREDLNSPNRNDPFAAKAMDDLMTNIDPVASVGFNQAGPAAAGSYRGAQEVGYNPNSALSPVGPALGASMSDFDLNSRNFGNVAGFSPGVDVGARSVSSFSPAGFTDAAFGSTGFSDAGFGIGVGSGTGIDGLSVSEGFGFGGTSNDFGGFGDVSSGSFSGNGLSNSFSDTSGFGGTAAAGLSGNTGSNADFGSFSDGFSCAGWFSDSDVGTADVSGAASSSSSSSGVSSSDSATGAGHSDDGIGGSECFLTTAASRAGGLPDDSEELQAMRHLRDDYMKKTPDGQRDIADYYAFAPSIVRAVNGRDDADDIWGGVLDDIRVVKDQVDAGMYEDAHATYRNLFHGMLARTAA